MKRYGLASLLFAVSACGPEVVTDIASACVVPDDLECTDPYMDIYGGCQGVYPADQPYLVRVHLRNPNGPFSDQECQAEIIGDHALMVSASFLSHRDRDEAAWNSLVEVHCSTPILESGTWTLDIEHGQAAAFVVDDDGMPQQVACATGD
jgi:hypothetical protein